MSVSVVIPSYNHAAFITEAVDSVLASEVPDLEVVVVEDGSTDDTLDRLAAYRSDPRVRVFEQANAGADAALNRCLCLARGDVLFILNSDDRYHAERIPRLVAALDRDPGLVMGTSWIRIVDGDGAEVGVKHGFDDLLPGWAPPRTGAGLADTGDPHLALLETNYPSTTSNIAFRRELVSRHSLAFTPLRYAHDWDFILSACAHGRLAIVEEPLVDYRVHDANTIREGRERDRGQGLMRFEILWVIARHARVTLDARATAQRPADELLRRFWRSTPAFAPEPLLTQLLLLRGSAPAPPPAYDDLLRPDHPFRVAAIGALEAT